MKTLKYGIKQGFKNIVQNKGYSLAAIGTISTCIFLFSVFYALLSNFQNILYNAESTVGITVFFDSGLEGKKIDEIGQKIRSCDGVKSIKYISPDEAWKEFSVEMYSEDDDIADTFGNDNPLADSASYEVFFDNVSDQKRISDYIENIDGVRKVNGSDAASKSLSNVNSLITYISFGIIILLLLVSIFLISSTVASGVRARKDELSIMRLVGATDLFIGLPFLVEGITIGFIGAVLPVVLFVVLYRKIIDFLISHFDVLSQWLTFVSTPKELKIIIPVAFAIGIGIGLLGSAVSVIRNTREVLA